jgi:hypothetical protein
MTLAPMNEAVRRDDQAEKTFVRKKINRHDWEVMEVLGQYYRQIRVRFC